MHKFEEMSFISELSSKNPHSTESTVNCSNSFKWGDKWDSCLGPTEKSMFLLIHHKVMVSINHTSLEIEDSKGHILYPQHEEHKQSYTRNVIFLFKNT